ncbi:hypothetical protein AGLY_014448 [Aphis glycines]|uniref:Uncharacterized protein n=1 Tax=Aphis glycines TaxID=307491 RepID=A0A6G0T4B5_APHGL|nr:hypothetical protein AGLY_014448 [Aphis glycines]
MIKLSLAVYPVPDLGKSTPGANKNAIIKNNKNVDSSSSVLEGIYTIRIPGFLFMDLCVHLKENLSIIDFPKIASTLYKVQNSETAEQVSASALQTHLRSEEASGSTMILFILCTKFLLEGASDSITKYSIVATQALLPFTLSSKYLLPFVLNQPFFDLIRIGLPDINKKLQYLLSPLQQYYINILLPKSVAICIIGYCLICLQWFTIGLLACIEFLAGIKISIYIIYHITLEAYNL